MTPQRQMDPRLITYYEAIERASADMLNAARAGDWAEVVKLEGACVLLITQLKHAAETGAHEDSTTQVNVRQALHVQPSNAPAQIAPEAMEAARAKSRIMQRILINDAEIRQLAEPWLSDLDDVLNGRGRTLH
jgi:flagellar protein FliT